MNRLLEDQVIQEQPQFGAKLHTLAEMRGASAAQDLNEGGAVFALPPLAGLVQSPGIAVNQLLTDSVSSASLSER